MTFHSLQLWFCSPHYSPTTPIKHAWLVWAFSFSLATTWEITIVFSSWGYLDVSVLPVRLPQAVFYVFNIEGCPIRKSSDRRLCAPTRSLSQLITSFIASVSLGIRHTPFLTFFTTVFAISLTWQRISSSYFQLYSNKVKSHLAIWFTLVWTKVHYLQFCLCQYVKDLFVSL